MPDIAIRKAERADLPALAKVLAAAFDDDPFVNWFVRKDAGRDAGFRRFFRAGLGLTFSRGETYTTDGRLGAALWSPPGTWKMGPLRQLRLLPAMGRTAGWARLPKALMGLNAVAGRHPMEPPHWYLFVLGVDPARQGQGVGQALLRPILERCDHERLPAYLETAKERNVPFYQKAGFRVREELAIKDGGPRLWLMWREPPR